MKISLTKLATSLSVATYGLMNFPKLAFAQTNDGINIGNIGGTTGFARDLGSVITTALSIVMGIAALAVFMYLIMGGIQWITSGGEKGKTEEARNKITAAVIGLIILAASYALLMLVLKILGFTSLTDALSGIKPIEQAANNGANAF